MIASKQWITHQYLLLDVTGAKKVFNILSLFWHLWLSTQYSSACTTFANTILPPYVHSYSSLSFYMEQSPGCSMHAHQPVCEPCMHTALVCMLAVHDTVCTLLQRTAGQGYWTYIVAKKKWGVLYVWWRQKSGWHYTDRMLHSAYKDWIYQFSVW